MFAMHGETDGNTAAHGELGTAVDAGPVKPLLWDIKTTCSVLGGITEQELRVHFRAGEITKVKIGRRAFALVESVEAYVAGLIERQKAAAK